jgi:hypothetical protein
MVPALGIENASFKAEEPVRLILPLIRGTPLTEFPKPISATVLAAPDMLVTIVIVVVPDANGIMVPALLPEEAGVTAVHTGDAGVPLL